MSIINDKKEILLRVYELAKERKCSSFNSKGEITISVLSDLSIEDLTNNQDDAKLIDYLEKLDFETIKMIQTIMYLGRNKDYKKGVSFEEIYIDYRQHHDALGWTDKEIEIDQMLGKGPLDRYLYDGYKILNIL